MSESGDISLRHLLAKTVSGFVEAIYGTAFEHDPAKYLLPVKKIEVCVHVVALKVVNIQFHKNSLLLSKRNSKWDHIFVRHCSCLSLDSIVFNLIGRNGEREKRATRGDLRRLTEGKLDVRTVKTTS